jgi:endonuclease/exonuclease/phosphatase family metal-dependent hydrolase
MSWNIQDLGETKFKKDTIISEIANVMKTSKSDIIAIQEVVTNNYGDSCIIKLSKLLNYNYIISEKTTGDGSERYAYLWRKTIKLDSAYLDSKLVDSLNREPYIASFKYKKKTIVVRQLHLVPTKKNPQNEVLKLYYKTGIICGDFNLTDKHESYNKLLLYFNSPLKNLPTSLKNDGTISENSYDHFFVEKKYVIKKSSVYFYNYKWNRKKLSDHLPILITL